MKKTSSNEIFDNYLKVSVDNGIVTLNKSDLSKVANRVKNATRFLPSQNFDENILKLANGLREYGFVDYANSLESKFVSYKSAQSLYGVSKETGKDLINEAHPDGAVDACPRWPPAHRQRPDG
jgi:hypothetical protein